MTNKERKLSNEILFKENLKICSTCIKIKSLNEYGIDKSNRFGYRASCKKCIKYYYNLPSYKSKQENRLITYKKDGKLKKIQETRQSKITKQYNIIIEKLKQELIKTGYKQISQNKNFYVNEYGNIKKLPPRIDKKNPNHWKLKDVYITKNHYGYLKFSMNAKPYRVHQIVAQEFLGHIPCGHKLVVDHIDGNITNNHYGNLQIISNYENLAKGMYKKTKEDRLLKYIKDIKY